MRLGMVFGLLAALLLFGGVVAFGDQGAAQEPGGIQVFEGWNQIVWEGDIATFEEALGDSYPDLEVAYYWRNDLQTFRRYIPGGPGQSSFHNLEPYKAYWLLISAYH